MNKYVAIVIVLILLGAGVYYLNTGLVGSRTADGYKCNFNEEPTYFLDGEVFHTELKGRGDIQGYYVERQKQAPFSSAGVMATCHSFVVTNGCPIVAERFVKMVNDGNTVNTKNELNQPVINIDFEELSNSEQETLLGSGKDNEVVLSIRMKEDEPRDADACHSFVDVLKVRN